MRDLSDVIKDKIKALIAHLKLSEKDYQTIAGYYESLKKLKIIENPYVLTLLGELRAVITAHFTKKVGRFDVCCAEGSSALQQEAKEILAELKSGMSYFDEDFQHEVNVPELEQRFNTLIKKIAAQTAVIELNDLEKQMRDYCMSSNFVAALSALETLEVRVSSFENEFAETKIPHRIKTSFPVRFVTRSCRAAEYLGPSKSHAAVLSPR